VKIANGSSWDALTWRHDSDSASKKRHDRRPRSNPRLGNRIGTPQMAHDLAKVGVEGSSPFARSNLPPEDGGLTWTTHQNDPFPGTPGGYSCPSAARSNNLKPNNPKRCRAVARQTAAPASRELQIKAAFASRLFSGQATLCSPETVAPDSLISGRRLARRPRGRRAMKLLQASAVLPGGFACRAWSNAW
jgi:hypothetical protein